MVKRLLGYDPLTGITEYFHMDDDDDHFTVETVQDPTPILEANREAFNSFNRPNDRFGEEIGGRTRIASIDLVKIEDLKKRGIWHDKPKLAAWLDTAEAAPYRTRPGHVS